MKEREGVLGTAVAVQFVADAFIAQKVIHVVLSRKLRTVAQIPQRNFRKRLRWSLLISLLRDLFTSEGI